MSSVHKECGADIVWAHREDDENRFYPPLEYIGEVFILSGKGREKIGKQEHGYRVHACDPDRIVEWQDYQFRLAEAKGEDYTPYAAAREKENEEMWNQVLHVECPRCKRPVGEKCISLARHLLKTGEIQETRNPHPARIEAFERWLRNEQDQDSSARDD